MVSKTLKYGVLFLKKHLVTLQKPNVGDLFVLKPRMHK